MRQVAVPVRQMVSGEPPLGRVGRHVRPRRVAASVDPLSAVMILVVSVTMIAVVVEMLGGVMMPV